MSVTSILTIAVYVLNVLFALVVIFISRKSPSSTWAWLFVFFFLPIIGFVLYLLLSRNLQKKHFVRWQAIHQQDSIMDSYEEQREQIRDGTYPFPNAITK